MQESTSGSMAYAGSLAYRDARTLDAKRHNHSGIEFRMIEWYSPSLISIPLEINSSFLVPRSIRKRETSTLGGQQEAMKELRISIRANSPFVENSSFTAFHFSATESSFRIR